MKTFPTLYKKTSTGAIQFWSIQADETNQGFTFGFGEIRTTYGQLGTDSPQITLDVIKEGKNTGKKNATTAVQQAETEAQAKWEKQLKKGYVQTMAAAQAGEIDDLIEGGVLPMLAHKFSDHGHKIKYPACIQPKLDGIRCIAIVKDSKCTLWSRTRKPITSMPHIVQEIEQYFTGNVILDGELYNHEFKNNFEHIVHLVRQENADVKCTDVQYHIYDVIDERTFEKRQYEVAQLLRRYSRGILFLKFVPTYSVEEVDVLTVFEDFKKQGYEGAMLRNADSHYVNKRSYDLQKVKEFEDAEFEILGVEEGRGKLAGHAGSFICQTAGGKTFLAKMAGETERLRDYFENHELWKGKKLTVQYQGLTGKEGVPRFPIGKAIRDYE